VPFQNGERGELKPEDIIGVASGTAKAVPFQSNEFFRSL